ncbi:MAG TPA: Mov34/MPN/PAD-1 family protein [Caulobacter sp.]|nr:Mov34/MPN/PAD-1 family protein [Caulobacter sp.]
MAAVDQTAVHLAVHEIAAHPAVFEMTGPIFSGATASLDIKLDLAFGSRWQAEGKSPTGVLPVEPVRLYFFSTFPRSAPFPVLRKDFSRNHPHIQPFMGPDGEPAPCLVDGSSSEFFTAYGAYRLIDQFVSWLQKAAEGRLIDPDQGWEPTRRDGLPDDLFCDPDALRDLVTDKGGYKLIEATYWWRKPTDADPGHFIGQLFDVVSLKDAFGGHKPENRKRTEVRGLGLAAVIWAGRAPSGGPVVCNEYLPDDVTDLEGLAARAERLRMNDGLGAVLALIKKIDVYGDELFGVPLIFAIRRPHSLIGSDSKIELCPYLLSVRTKAGEIEAATLRPLALYEAITGKLLSRLTDTPGGEPWALLGCGSLGSKIALHRARDGVAPVLCIDKAAMRPHNAARHALYPRESRGGGWLGPKAEVLAEVIAALGQDTVSGTGDHRSLSIPLKTLQPKPLWLLNTTASTVVREDLTTDFEPDLPRLAEACLFNKGSLGYLGVEGVQRNPDAVELMGELYSAAERDPALGQHLFPLDGQLTTVNVGQGCGSLTMKVSDAKLSILASAVADTFTSLSTNQPDAHIDLYRREGYGLHHTRILAPAWTRLPLDGLNGWTLSVSPRAIAAIEAETARHKRVETGGLLIGFHSMIARRIYVTDVMAAPADSRRTASEFVLGVKGLAAAREALALKTRGALTFAGTWHSHLGAATPSEKDRRSAQMVGEGELQPKAFLIRGANGLRAISAVAVAANNIVQPA